MKNILNENQAIDLIFAKNENSVNVINLGFASRYVKSVHNPPNTFYMNGAMGLCLSFSIGIAMQTAPNVYCIIGDGALIMNLQSLLLLKSTKKDLGNLKIFLIDNKCHNSTGYQPTFSEKINFRLLCKAFKIKYFFANTIHSFNSIIEPINNQLVGPCFIHILVSKMTIAPPRIIDTSVQIKDSFLLNKNIWLK